MFPFERLGLHPYRFISDYYNFKAISWGKTIKIGCPQDITILYALKKNNFRYQYYCVLQYFKCGIYPNFENKTTTLILKKYNGLFWIKYNKRRYCKIFRLYVQTKKLIMYSVGKKLWRAIDSNIAVDTKAALWRKC